MANPSPIVPAKARQPRKLPWHQRRFAPQDHFPRTECAECGVGMWMPPSKAHLYLRCSPECNAAWRARVRDQRRRECETCGATFYPRTTQIAAGAGRFCAQKCNTSGAPSARDPEIIKRRVATRKASIAAGTLVFKKGPESPSWKGGREARKERQNHPAEIAKRRSARRAYLAKNPERAKEWVHKRANTIIGRLPRGTITRIIEAQKYRCAICRTSVRKKRHVDHVVPLKRGGKHEPRNIQILCPTCNVRKNAKDPIDYMRELGRLL